MTTDAALHVVIPTLGRAILQQVVRDCLTREDLLTRLTVVAQTPVTLPVDTWDLARSRGVQLDLVQLDAPIGAALARDVGTRRGSEPWVGWLDDDILFVAGSLSQLVQTCQARALAGSCGVVVNAAQNTAPYRLFKRLLFRGIFDDPRPRALLAEDLVPSRVLSGGMTVYRREAYERCRHTQLDYSGYTWGEDFVFSYCVSSAAEVMIDPTVRVRNEATGVRSSRDASEVAVARLHRYRDFARQQATSRRDWFHYLGVLLGVLVVGLREGGGRPVARAVGQEVTRAVRSVLVPARR
jgi:hypothetical protein